MLKRTLKHFALMSLALACPLRAAEQPPLFTGVAANSDVEVSADLTSLEDALARMARELGPKTSPTRVLLKTLESSMFEGREAHRAIGHLDRAGQFLALDTFVAAHANVFLSPFRDLDAEGVLSFTHEPALTTRLARRAIENHPSLTGALDWVLRSLTHNHGLLYAVPVTERLEALAVRLRTSGRPSAGLQDLLLFLLRERIQLRPLHYAFWSEMAYDRGKLLRVLGPFLDLHANTEIVQALGAIGRSEWLPAEVRTRARTHLLKWQAPELEAQIEFELSASHPPESRSLKRTCAALLLNRVFGLGE